MFNLSNMFKGHATQQNNSQQTSNNAASPQSVKAVKTWYEERYDKLIVQRNWLVVLIFTLLFLSVATIISIAVVVNAKKFDPFVIQLDETTGMAKIVNPVLSDVIDGNEALAKYFIKRYVIARETYNPVDFDTEARKTIRLLSTSGVFFNYIGYIKNKEIDPTIIYGQKNTTFLIIKSWSKLDQKKYMVRFSVNETAEGKRVYNKIAVVDFDYVPMELTEAERDINPIGFQVKGYRVDNDNS